nr:hypothetical protein [Tanacetum cinerariifolium]
MGIDIANAISGPTFAELYDDDVVGLCCLGILQLVLLDAESRRNVPEWLLRIANDRVAWNKYPWGSYVWPTLYSQLRNANVRRWGALYVDQPTNEDDPTTYSIFEYTWAFKTWILESFRVTAIRYFDRFNRYPRVAAWSKKKERFLAEMVIPLFEGGLSSFKGHANSSFFNMGMPSNFQTPMRSQPGSSDWKRQMPEQSAKYSESRKRQQLPSKYLVTPFTAQPPTTMVPKQHVSKTENKGKKANLSPLNLGGVLECYNEEDNNVTFLGSLYW